MKQMKEKKESLKSVLFFIIFMSRAVDFLKKLLYSILVFTNKIITKTLQKGYKKVTISIDFFYKI